MAEYRGKNKHREAHPKIVVWSHTKKAEIEYFQGFKNYLQTPLLVPRKDIHWKPQDLLDAVAEWKRNPENICEKDGDQVWCVFDVDDFFKDSQDELLQAVKTARNNNIKIAYANECFEFWILLHFKRTSAQIKRGSEIEKEIQKEFKKNGLREFKKNQKVFDILLPFQEQAIENARILFPSNYEKIDWTKVLSEKGNPSTNMHLLVEEINHLFGSDKNNI